MWDWFFSGYGDYHHGGSTTTSSVPEIDASSGVLAIAVVFAALALACELKRRRRAQG